ncbi:SH3 domain-containing protein [Sphingomonas koreensis]|nr:SH3 domain-containing protein [Sphingomonas koreensis]
MRRDLADVRLADKVFAPHYVQPLAMTATVATPVLATAAATADAVSQLEPGDIFDVLEIANTHSWGQCRADRMVGYVANDALTPMVVTDDAA